MTKKIVALGGDGIGPEVVDAAVQVLESMGLDIEILKPLVGETAIKRFGTPFPKDAMDLTNQSDAILFGATEQASVVVLAYLRWVLDTYTNLRPIKHYKGVQTPIKDPEGIDFLIVRENSEGMYPGREGDISLLAEKLPDYKDLMGKSFADFGKGKFAIRIITEKGCRRITKAACEKARERKKRGFSGKVTCVTKSNVLRESCGLFQKTCEEVIKGYPELKYEHFYVDDMARRIIRSPKDIDVIVTSNMFGDILSDLAGELMGGLGMAPSACIGDRYAYFEPVHGSAPDIAGKGIANPTATILSSVMMLEYLGMREGAEELENAVKAVYEEGGVLTPDMGGKSKTRDVTKAVIQKLK